MIRNLLIITGASIVLCVVSLAGAAALGGRDLDRHNWNWTFGDGDGDSVRFERDGENSGPAVSRDLAWTGGDSLQIDVPGEVTYVQGAQAGVRITGPKAMADRVRVVDGRLTFDDDNDGDGSRTVRFHVNNRRWDENGNPVGNDDTLRITVTAPSVKTIDLNSSADLRIRGYDQPTLNLTISGSGAAEATGGTDALVLDISGSGEADLDGFTTRDATVDISGSGEARVASTGKAEIDISGSGEVTLTRRPAEVTQRISGSGEVHQD